MMEFIDIPEENKPKVKQKPKTSTLKAKGRRFQQKIRDVLLKHFTCLGEKDIRSTPMGSSGSDLIMSERACQLFPFDIECKNVEKPAIWQTIQQSQKRTQKDNLHELLIFSKNHRKEYIAMIRIDLFLKLVMNIDNMQGKYTCNTIPEIENLHDLVKKFNIKNIHVHDKTQINFWKVIESMDKQYLVLNRNDSDHPIFISLPFQELLNYF